MRPLVCFAILLGSLPALAAPPAAEDAGDQSGPSLALSGPARAANSTAPAFTFKLEAGATLATVFDAGIGGGSVNAAFGIRFGRTAIYTTGGLLVGATRFGLPVEHWKSGFAVELHRGRFGFGVGQEVGALFIERATSNAVLFSGAQAPLTDMTVGGYGFVTLDLAPARRFKPYLSVRIGADYALTFDTPLVAGTLAFGFRL